MKELNQIVLQEGFLVSIKRHLCLIKGQEVKRKLFLIGCSNIKKKIFFSKNAILTTLYLSKIDPGPAS